VARARRPEQPEGGGGEPGGGRTCPGRGRAHVCAHVCAKREALAGDSEGPGLHYVFASRIFRSLLSRSNVHRSASGLAGSEGDHDGCIAQRAS